MSPTGIVYVFGRYRLIPRRQLLMLGDRPVKLGGRAFELLQVLVRRSGVLVSKAELIAAAWPNTFVDDSNLKANIHQLRRTLGDTRKRSALIATVAGRGYRFVAAVDALPCETAVATESAAFTGLPALGEIVGRDREIGEIMAKIGAMRLVTIVGAGGVGKTTVAVAVAKAFEPECPDGVCFLDLSTIEDQTLVPSVLVSALGLRGNRGDALAAAIAFLRSRRMLVLLDNCEHVLPAAATFAHAFAAAGTPSKLLATSREPLGTPAEHVHRLEPLECPDDGDGPAPDQAMRFPALVLFGRRALDIAGRHVVDADIPAIAQICRALDGLPLAIELAASELDRHSVQELLALLHEHLRFHPRRAAGVPPRQATLFATIDWSFRLLSSNEVAIFLQVSVFASAFEIEDALALAAPLGLSPADVTIGIGSLVAKSLLKADIDGDRLRYRLLDSTRRYATERRLEASTDAAIRHRHAERMLALFRRSEAEWPSWAAEDWILRYRPRLADLRAALSWAFGDGDDPELGLRLTAAAIPLWFEISLMSEAQAWVERVLEASGPRRHDDLLIAKLACFRAWSLVYARHLPPEIEGAWLAAIALAERAGAIALRLQTLVGLSFYLLDTGRLDQAIERLEEFRHLSEHHRYREADPEGERVLAFARAHAGQLTESRMTLERLAAQFSRPDTSSRMAGFQVDRYIGIRCYLPFVAWLNGHPDQAAAAAHDAIDAAARRGHLASQSNAMALAGLPVSLWTGDLAALEHYTTSLRAILELESIGVWLPVERFFAAALAEARGERHAIRRLRAALDHLVESRFLIRIGMCFGVLAEALARRGRLGEAGRTIATALDYQARQGEVWCQPELLRIEASILRRGGQHRRAGELLRGALAQARDMGAMSFELRIANDLAEHYVDTERHGDAIRVLGPIHGRFTEGFGTKDLIVATNLLERANRSSL